MAKMLFFGKSERWINGWTDQPLTYNLDYKSILYDFTTNQMLLGDVRYRGVIVIRHIL